MFRTAGSCDKLMYMFYYVFLHLQAVVAAEAASIAESLGGSVRRIIRPKMQSSRKTKIAQTQSKENIENVAQPASCPPAADFTPDDLALEHMRGITQVLYCPKSSHT